MSNRKRGSIALARSLCYQINGAADDSDDMDGGGYGSVDIAEILSAEVLRLQKALAQPEQEPVAWGVFDGLSLHDMFFTEEEALEMVRLKGDGSMVKPLHTSPPAQRIAELEALLERQTARIVDLQTHIDNFDDAPW